MKMKMRYTALTALLCSFAGMGVLIALVFILQAVVTKG